MVWLYRNTCYNIYICIYIKHVFLFVRSSVPALPAANCNLRCLGRMHCACVSDAFAKPKRRGANGWINKRRKTTRPGVNDGSGWSLHYSRVWKNMVHRDPTTRKSRSGLVDCFKQILQGVFNFIYVCIYIFIIRIMYIYIYTHINTNVQKNLG